MKNIDNKFNIIKKSDFIKELDFDKTNIVFSSKNNFLNLEIKENKKLILVEVLDESLDDRNIKREIKIAKNATLEYLKLSSVDCDFDFSIDSNEDTNSYIHFIDLDKNNKNKIDINLEKKNINLNINALVNLKDDASAFNSFNITHKHPNTYSDIKVRHLLDDKSSAEFEAISIIENNALYSKAFQDSKTILLSDDASIKARPHLEILTDELEASHGATTGGIDKDAVYYLMSRGLSKEKANAILIEAFANSMIENIQTKDLKKWVYEQIRSYHV